MMFIKKSWYKIVLLGCALSVPLLLIYASESCLPGTICNPVPSMTSIPKLIQTILEGVLRIGIPIVALAIIYCGFLFVAARGNSEKLTKARDALLYTVIGAAILLGSWAIAKMISTTVLSL
ncbi:MAG: hypothetical protein V1484_02585 [bacterium]